MTVIIGFVSQKGGVGKSTLARAVAREAAAGELVVKIADLDPQQGTSVNWARRRLAAGIEPVVPVEPFGSVASALKVANQVDLLVLDGPAHASVGTLQIARAANLVVQPSGAGLDDLMPAVETFHDLVNEGVPREKLVIALCRIGSASEEMDARVYLGKAGYAVLPGSLPERTSFRQAQNEGHSVTEIRFAGLSEKADRLVQSIFDLIDTSG